MGLFFIVYVDHRQLTWYNYGWHLHLIKEVQLRKILCKIMRIPLFWNKKGNTLKPY